MTALDRAIPALAGPTGRRLFSWLTLGRASVFFFHRLEQRQYGVRGLTAEFISNAIAMLRRSGATLVSLRDVIDARARGLGTDGRWVAFTIDDGFVDQYEIAKEVFVKQACPVTIFPVTGFLDGELWPWDDQLAYAFRHAQYPHLDVEIEGRSVCFSWNDHTQCENALLQVREWCKRRNNRDLYPFVHELAERMGCSIPLRPPKGFEAMSWSQARELERMGVDFGVHTVTHRIMSRLDSDGVDRELRESWGRLRTELASPLGVVAWPTGRAADFSNRDEDLARQIGLIGGVSTEADYAVVGKRAAGFTISRFSLPESKSRLLQYGSWIERGKQLARSIRS